jgi:hypothetical protein
VRLTNAEAPAFLTGSRAYSNYRVTKDSDWDFVVLAEDGNTLIDLCQAADQDVSEAYVHTCVETGRQFVTPSASVKVGKINLIVTTSRDHYDDWRTGTDRLLVRASLSMQVTREEAKDVFRELFQKRHRQREGEPCEPGPRQISKER